MASLLTLAEQQLAKAIVASLEDPAVRAQMAEATGALVASPEFRRAAIPLLIQGALFIGLAVFGGMTLYRVVFDRR